MDATIRSTMGLISRERRPGLPAAQSLALYRPAGPARLAPLYRTNPLGSIIALAVRVREAESRGSAYHESRQ